MCVDPRAEPRARSPYHVGRPRKPFALSRVSPSYSIFHKSLAHAGARAEGDAVDGMEGMDGSEGKADTEGTLEPSAKYDRDA